MGGFLQLIDQDGMCFPFNLLASSETNVHPLQLLFFLDSFAPIFALLAIKSTQGGRSAVLWGVPKLLERPTVRYTYWGPPVSSVGLSLDQLFNQSSTDDNSVGE